MASSRLGSVAAPTLPPLGGHATGPRRTLDRRLFLRGLGGACVGAPFLTSLQSRTAGAQSESTRRLIVMFTHYGCITTRFFPENSHGPLTAADLEPTTLKHLAPYADQILMPRGIRAMNQWTDDVSLGQGNDTHAQVCGAYFTCHPISPNSNDPFRFTQATRFAEEPIERSLDHVMAEQISPEGTPLFMRVSGAQDNFRSAISYSAARTGFPGFGSLRQVYESLTGLFAEGSMSADTYAAVRGQSIVDLVAGDIATLERLDLSASDKRKLEAWKSLLHETGEVASRAECSEAGALHLDLNMGSLAAMANTDGDRVSAKVTDTLDFADVYTNMAVLAALCDANPVIFLKYPGSWVFRGLGLDLESHSLSHRIGNAGMGGTCIEDALEKIWTLDDYYARKFAHLVAQLDAIDEGEGTMLDNTAAVWFQEMSDGNTHNLNNLPIVQAGSCGGYFKTGWAVNVDDGASDLTRGNSEVWCTEEGGYEIPYAGVFESGTDPLVANAPINKYYCNLMNALGVKGGDDGFPLLGGSGEVTHYGMYDKTEDFVGGGTNPPMIHDPGEFVDLKAG